MVKKCKQCGRQLTPDESNNLCENCRKNKREWQAGWKDAKEKSKKKKYFN